MSSTEPVTFGFGEDHSDEKLVGMDLTDELLRECTFDRATLDDSDLSTVDAAGASFKSASLARTQLVKTNLHSADFTAARAPDAVFTKAELRGARFTEATLNDAVFQEAFLADTSFTKANLRGASLVRAKLIRTDFRGADLTGANFEGAIFERSVRLEECVGLDTVVFNSVNIGGNLVEGDAARAHLASRAKSVGITREQLEEFYADEIAGRPGSPDVGRVFSIPMAAIDFERVLGPPVARRDVDASGTFYGSVRNEFVLSRWPTLRFGVNSDLDGAPWNIGFTGGPAQLPASTNAIEPGAWTLDGLKALGAGVEVEDEWDYDLDAILTIGAKRYRAKFRYGVLTSWQPEA